jgi:hypothetical protein
MLWLLLFLACAPRPSSTPSDGGAAAAQDAGLVTDAAVLADAAVTTDAGPGSGSPCTFNVDCPAAERCECDEATGCACHPGTRGTGVNGVDTCVTGNDCETALCVEGNGGPFYCSGECSSSAQCASHLPVCSSIAFVGRVCIRSPDGGL